MPAVAHIGNSRRVSINRHYCLPFFRCARIVGAPSQNHHRNGIKSTSYSQIQTQLQNLVSLIKSCSQYDHLLQFHAYIISTSLLQFPSISIPFLSRLALSPVSSLSYSRQFFEHLPDPYVSHYNTMIKAYSLSNLAGEGFNMYQEMRRRGIHANPLSSMFVIKCCAKLCSLTSGEQIHGCILKDGHQSDSVLLTTLMDFYSICTKWEEACKVFDEIPKRDTVAWNVLISCYLRNRRTRDALVLFDNMKTGAYGCEPDDVTCLLILQACTSLGALEFGEGIHSYIEERGYGNALNLSNSLIAMYSQCGCLQRAHGVFEGMRNKNVVSWSAMIYGFATNGYGREAIEAFEEMQRNGILPDEQTFTGVLCACSHCGFVNEGMMFFDRMREEFGIIPNIHHYGCMVDLLGRAGQLDEAYRFILSMEVKPDSKIWRTLLGACRIHRHFTLGERIVSHLIELKAEEAGDYVLLLNIYSSISNWDKVLELRAFMKEKGIQTTSGCSTIEVKGVLHEFIADDVSHPRKDEIYEKLDEINKQLKIAGYVAEITSELHNLGAEEKECVLSYHSEKLAIAFGVLATPPGTTIRVAKNIRSCVDCHKFAEFLSAVYNRIIIIRDRTRFHHFREGHCSCNGYW